MSVYTLVYKKKSIDQVIEVFLHSKHRCLYTTHPSLHQHPHPHTKCHEFPVLYMQAEWMAFLVYPFLHFATRLLLLQLQTGHADSNFVQPMHFTCYFLQWHLRTFTSNNLKNLLNDSTGDNSQEYRLILSTIRKYIYNSDVYTKVAVICPPSISHIYLILKSRIINGDVN